MIEHLGAYERVSTEADADAIVINSCTVTNGADAGVRNYVSRIRLADPSKKILFTGCGVASEGKKLHENGKIDILFSHAEKERIGDFLSLETKGAFTDNTRHIDTTIVSHFEGKSKAFIKIQEGCDFRCSYCIIPSVRGESRSIPASIVLEQIHRLVDNGYEEFVLTGTNVGSYRDNDTTIATLIAAIVKIPGIRRLRLGSVEPSQIDDAFLDAISSDIFARHLHVALQHTSNTMLTYMNRHNRFESDYALCTALANRGFALGSDYIVGFPGETDKLWQQAYQNLAALPLTHIHPFIFSRRDGTPAARLKQDVRGDIAKARLHEITTLIEDKNRQFREHNHHTSLLVHVEESHGTFGGFDQFYNRVQFDENPGHSWVRVDTITIMQGFSQGAAYAPAD